MKGYVFTYKPNNIMYLRLEDPLMLKFYGATLNMSL